MRSIYLYSQSAIYALTVMAGIFDLFSASAYGASSSQTSFAASVPFECEINNNNISAVTLEAEEATLSRVDAVKLAATSATLDVSGNGFSAITFDYTQTKGEAAFYTFLNAISPLLAPRISNYMSFYTMQNGSIVNISEAEFPRLTSTSQPVKIYFRADVKNTPGNQYEFVVTMTCLQKTP